MKKILAGMALQFATAFAGADHYQSELNLVSADRNMIAVSLDNNYYSPFTSNFGAGNIQPGTHYISIVKRYFLNTHGFSHHRNYKDEVVFRGYLEFPVASRISGTLDCFNRLSLNIQNIGYQENYFQNTNYIAPPYIGMDEHSFRELKSVIANRWFDSSKLEVAKQGISGSAISSAQLAELMGLLSFESNKLELAKFAYRFVADKQKFFLVNDSFTFESSIGELDRFVRRVV
ncbi:MAG TPA: DUF4476 domain-containing protein [Bacteroidia bacterium]|nr:DUF4476 domain-containing protein [Bacteroidia bacterium]